MRIITQREIIKQKVLERDRAWWGNKPGIAEADPETITVDEFNSMVGTAMIQHLACNQCDRKVDRVVEVGEESGVETATAWLCIDCVEEALKLLKS